jgi:adenosylhomocysteine nucleosidase
MWRLYSSNSDRYNLKCYENEIQGSRVMKIIVLISAIAEWEGFKLLYPQLEIQQSPFGEITNLTLDTWHLTLCHAGWGKIASAAMMQYVIDRCQPDLIVNLGTCGGFAGVVNQGDVILVDKTFVYDIVELMGELDISTYYATSLDLSWLAEPYPHPVRRGAIASADSDLPPDKIPFLKSKGAIAADWESAALAWVAQKNKARLLILRGVSDMVSEQGGEAYNNIEIFNQRAREIMKTLFEQLPDWLNALRL